MLTANDVIDVCDRVLSRLKEVESDVSCGAETKQLTESVMRAYNGCLYRCLTQLKKTHGLLDIGISWPELLNKSLRLQEKEIIG